jgi:hypothetical protein
VGSGVCVPQVPDGDAKDWAGSLEGFSAKPYLKTVRGYLDPAGAYVLAACALALGHGDPVSAGPQTEPERRGICAVSWYGACLSAYRFFEQFSTKGPRLASPLVFPHGYVSTAPNLAAIEFACAGPHMVFTAGSDTGSALAWAAGRLRDEVAESMLVVVYEAPWNDALAGETELLPGAVALELTRGTGAELEALFRESVVPGGCHPQGAVRDLLERLAVR